MRNKNWQQVESIFHGALTLGGDERVSYLSEKCSDDAALRSEIESLLIAFENESGFLEDSAFSLGMNVLGQDNEKDLTGEKIGFYEIKEKLGGGGMGNVYLAEDTRLNRKVALKFLKKAFADDKWAKRQFIKEAQAVAMLEHPNICAVHSIEEIGEHNFIAMQYIEGETLAEIISERRLSSEKILFTLNQIMSAVAAAHSHGIIHRDIKPGNIMITPEGLVKVLDFGLAKVVEHKQKRADDNASQFSQNGLILGTVSYMSPEQLRGERLDYRTDIFSVGIVLYEVLSGKRPFHRTSQAETIAAILSAEPLEINDAEIPGALVSIARKCLNKDKEKRFQSASEILVELENAKITVGAISKRQPGFFVKAASLLLIMLAVLAVIFFNGKSSAKTLAVLPITFENPPPADKEYLADGLTQSIIDELSNLSGVNVKNESLVMPYKKQGIEPQVAGKALKVDTVFVGTIQKRGDELFLITRLISTSDGFVIDANESKIEEANLTDLQENISARIISKIESTLTNDDKTKLAKKDTESEDAKRLYLLGRFYLKRRKGNEDLEKAVQSFTDAKDLDQNYAKAWAGLADAYISLSLPGVKNAMAPATALAYAKSFAKRALELDHTICETYNSLGLISSKYEWNWSEAEAYFRTAINRDPEFLPARNGLINVLNMQGRFDESMEEAKKIKEFDPISITSDLKIAEIYYRKRDYVQMDKTLSDLLERFSDNKRISYLRVYQFLSTERFKEAAEILEKMYNSANQEDKVFAAAPLGFAYAKMERRDEALKIIQDLEDFRKNNYVPPQEKALIYLGLGNYEKVFENLDISCTERFPSLPGLITDPMIDEIKADPRFLVIKECVNL